MPRRLVVSEAFGADGVPVVNDGLVSGQKTVTCNPAYDKTKVIFFQIKDVLRFFVVWLWKP